MRLRLPVAPEPRALGDRCCDPGIAPRLTAEQADDMAQGLELLANPIRLQLLDLLARHEGRVCVCDLEAAVPVKQPTVSHHLRLLRAAGLVEREKVGQWAYYRVHRPALQRLRRGIAETLALFA